MKINTSREAEVIRKEDRERVLPYLEGIKELILSNPFTDRIQYLLRNPTLAHNPVKNLEGEFEIPNCIGTVLYIAGVSALNYPFHGYGKDLNGHMKRDGEDDVLDSVSYHYERRIPGAFAFSFIFKRIDWHAGIYLGEVDHNHFFFTQHGHNKPFGVESIAYHATAEYFIPKTLQEKIEENQ